jgi:2-methylcitrate dehydratase PrpD
MGAQYSIPYCAAVALLGDPRDPEWYQGDAITNPATRALAKEVEIVIDPAIEAVYPAQFGASVKLTRADGSVFERTVLDCHGTPADPRSPQEQLEKFRLLAGTRLPPDAIADLVRLVEVVETLASVRDLTKPLRAGAAALVYERKKA